MRFMEHCFVFVSVWIILLRVYKGSADASPEEDKQRYKDTLSSLPSTWHEIVYPVQVRNGDTLPSVDTRDHKSKQKNAHYHSTNFEINFLGKKHRMKMELNRELLPNGFKLKYNQNSKVQVVEETSIENCFYQGQVRRVPDSLVVLSTCSGIRGVIILSHDVYFILPLPRIHNTTETDRFPHVIYLSVPDTKTKCANERGMWLSYKDLHHGEFLRNLKIMKVDGDSIVSDTKYMRTALVVDYQLYSRLNRSLTDTLQYIALVSNIADALLNDANVKIKLRLVYVELWNQDDLFEVSRNAREALTAFLRYRKETLTHVQFDYAHFMSGQNFDSHEIGMALPDSVCSDRAVAVSKSASVHDTWQSAYGVVHMLAHVLGVSHDTTEHCTCSYRTGCIMSQSSPLTVLSPHARSWSTCSIKDIHTSIRSRLGNCLSSANATSSVVIAHEDVMYKQTCGNGVTERGEECDCQNKEECELLDPCCDAFTCLLKPWATCRRGDCCYNCTVRPSNQMCRSAVGECDVPEFCDGLSGHCPSNTLTQDGQPCDDEHGYCYRGICRTYSQQCKSLWGQSAVAADDKCYDTFNTAGRFNGHCGHNGTATDYVKCAIENTKCGLLHCSGGADKPLTGHNQTFSKTIVYSDGKEYECKIVNGVADGELLASKWRVGMVQDGSRCGPSAVCLGSECVALSHVMPASCVQDSNGAVCSGHGVCTTDLRCFCSAGYTGPDCSERTNITFIPLSTSTTPWAPSSESIELLLESRNVTENVTATTTAAIMTSNFPHPGARADATSTWWLFIVLVIVIGAAVILLAFCLLCYRRKSPQNQKIHTKVVKRGAFSSLTSFGSSTGGKQQETQRLSTANSNSVVKFGKTPSWKAEKMKRAMKQQRESAASETGSADRDSTELKQVPSLPPADPPERGILKKNMSRTSVDGVKRPRASSQSSLVSHAASTKPPVELGTRDKSLVYDKQSADQELTFIDGDAEEDQCSYCDCSVEEDGDPDIVAGSTSASVCSKSGCNQETQTDLESADSSLSRTSLYDNGSSRLARLCNINELLRQIDEQFNNVLRATNTAAPYLDTVDLSPTNSEDFRCSETEADRACAVFYRQSDADTKPLSAAPTLERPGLSHSLQSSVVPVATQVQQRSASAAELPLRMSFKPLALPQVPKLHEVGCSPDKETDVQWRPKAFVPYRGLSTSSDSSRWDVPAVSVTLPSLIGTSSSPATVPSEGYHSDRGGTSELDGPIILREIPRPLASANDCACDTATLSSGLLHSPDDVDV